MSKLPLLETQVAIDRHNLAVLQALYDNNASFTTYAKSINEIFYYYVQNCTDNPDELFIDRTDVQCVLDVVNSFLQLQEPLLE
ncbi:MULTISPECIES: hypothetical protein [unclassified Myroides]|uniref:hypothetical protein n=1 Tax=unclassified Myroides TaxID=2642485 RepID=UPI003D2F61D7